MSRVLQLPALDEDAERRRFANLRARLALRGFVLHELATGGYLVGRWDRTKYAPDLAAVAAFLAQVTGERD